MTLPVCPTPSSAYLSMPQFVRPGEINFCGTPLPDLAAGSQIVTPLFDFHLTLTPGVYLSSTPQVTCNDENNVDPSPSSRIVTQAGIFGSGVYINCSVAAQIASGVAGANYLLTFSAIASNGTVWTGWTHMKCVNPS
ncbi:MAG: hypothetical protein KGJ90_00445 [Patescibacteria group bacterium]|nr:hypothetical protein [Patescibacteria group bacterium]